ncbi:secretion/conjugation apparatus DotM-related subunit [Bilophila wadsworthia]|uniref:secretion/conjugation apparatus DotM-related subunit n=1 Tax=Bilophila wadsworthia TaxID=35833 RepID=UPI00266B68C3|nr:hypothetical protein [Bilophila wadsworthia]
MNGRDNRDDHLFLWCAFLILVFVVLPALYIAHADSVNRPLLALAKAQIQVFTPFFDEAQTAWTRIAEADPASLSWETMQKVLHYTGSWIRWPFALLLVLFGVATIFMGRVGGLVRRFNMESLLKNNAESFPCLRPVVGRGKYLLAPESYDSGLWKVARTPAQFALEHGLLLDEQGKPFSPEQALKNGLPSTELPVWGNARLDGEKALRVLTEQLGKRFEGYEGLSPCRRALAVAFLAYADGDKKGCVALLDAVSLSYREENEQASCPLLEDNDFTNKLKKQWERHASVLNEKCLSIHASYELPWFMALLYRARQKGVLASSQFLWLRPLDRPLWYALNQCGGRAAWAEGFAPWAHYTAEEKERKTLTKPHVAPAVASLREALSAQGWLTEIFVPPAESANTEYSPDGSAQASSPIEPPPDMVVADAEDDPEYDANEDPSLAQQDY